MFNLQFLVLPSNENYTTINTYAFYFSQITDITIPPNVKAIWSPVFSSQQLQCVALQNPECVNNQQSYGPSSGECFVQNNAFQGYQGDIKKGSDQYCDDYKYRPCNETYEYIKYIGYPNYCLSEENVDYFYIGEDGNKYYTDGCTSEQYQLTIDGVTQCGDDCGQEASLPVQGLICSTECLFYINDQQQRQCAENDQCPDGYTLIIQSTPQQCATECPEQQYKYQQESYCVQQCTDEYAQPISGNICDLTCKYSTETIEQIEYKICQTTCPDTQQYEVINTIRLYCISECPQEYYKYEQQLQCVESCEENLFINENTKECFEQCPSDLYQQDKYCQEQCTNDYAQPIDQTNKICDLTCKYYKQTIDEIEYKYCTESCPSEQYEIIDLVRSYCDLQCPQDLFIQETEKQCVEQCDIEQYPYYQGMTCITECQEPYQYIQVNECVEQCGDEYLYEQQNCVDQCSEQNLQDGQYCVEQCSDQSYFIQNKVCVQQCTDEYAHPIGQEKECSNSCMFYTNVDDSYKYCTEECSGSYQYTYPSTPIECVSQCQNQYPYIQEQSCIQHCSDEYAKPQQGNVCDNQCTYYTESMGEYLQKICYNGRCPSNQPLIQQDESGRRYCTNGCEQDQVIQDSECLDQCDQGYYVQITTCVQQCSEQYSHNEQKLICDNQCMFYINSTSNKVCTIDQQNCPQDYSLIIQSTPIQCIDQCSQDYPYQQDIYCQTECTNDYAFPQDTTNKVCDDQCMYYINETSQLKYCTDSCPNTQQYQVQDPNRQYCIEQCPEEYYIQEQQYQCVQQCNNDYAQPILGNVCDLDCTYYTQLVSEIEYKYCTETCPQQQQYEVQTQRKYCVQQCPTEYYTSQNELQCVQECNQQLYSHNTQNKQCDSNCMYYIDNELDIKICTVDQQQCPQDYQLIIQTTPVQCISQCPEDQYQYQQNVYCQNECTGEYAYSVDQNNKVCDNTCLYYINDQYKYCTEQCPIDQQYTQMNNDRQQCVEQCQYYWYQYNSTTKQCIQQSCQNIQNQEQQLLKYLQNNECVEQCQNIYYYIQNQENICSQYQYCDIEINEQILNSTNEQDKTCITQEQCMIQEYYYIFNSSRNNRCQQYNVEQCNQIEDYEIQSINGNQCVQYCEQDQYWYQVEEQDICVVQCWNVDLYGLNIDNNQCVDKQVCQENYYILVNNEQQQEYCQYSSNVQQCSQYEEYEEISSLQCTDCSNSQYQVQDIDNIQTCVQKPNKSNGGLIAGVIIAVIVVIILAVGLSFYFLKKKNMRTRVELTDVVQEDKQKQKKDNKDKKAKQKQTRDDVVI